MDRLDFKFGIRRPDELCCLFSKYRLEGSPTCPRLNLSRLRTQNMPNQQIIQPSMLKKLSDLLKGQTITRGL